jgi:very-short-patch-repair endonuclease
MKLDSNAIVKEYNEGKSPQELAEKYGTYSNKIRRILKKYVELRGRSEANKIAIESGRKEHPTKGKKLTEAHKTKISEAAANNWANISEEKYENYVLGCKERWNNMSSDEKQKLNDLAHDAIRLSAKEGSKLERFVVEQLKQLGTSVVTHKTGLIPNDKLEVDIYLPDIATCLEIDGPSHFFPIWGQEHLNKQIKADVQKAGLLLSAGFVLVRIKCLSNHLSEKTKRELIASLIPILTNIKNNRPKDSIDRFIEIEV